MELSVTDDCREPSAMSDCAPQILSTRVNCGPELN